MPWWGWAIVVVVVLILLPRIIRFLQRPVRNPHYVPPNDSKGFSNSNMWTQTLTYEQRVMDRLTKGGELLSLAMVLGKDDEKDNYKWAHIQVALLDLAGEQRDDTRAQRSRQAQADGQFVEDWLREREQTVARLAINHAAPMPPNFSGKIHPGNRYESNR